MAAKRPTARPAPKQARTSAPRKGTAPSKVAAAKVAAAKLKAAPAKPSAVKRAGKPVSKAAGGKPPVATVARVARPVAAGAPMSAAAQRWSLVTAKDIMRSEVVTVSYASPLSEVERVLADNRISGAPVVDEKGAIIGVISVKDLVERYAEDSDARPRRGHGFFHLSSEETLDEDFDSFEVPEEAEETARDVMTATIYTVAPGAGLREIADVLCQHKVHRVLVEAEGRLVGLISTIDILDALRA